MLCHSNLDFFVIFMFKYYFIDISSLRILLWSAEDVWQGGHSQARVIAGGLNIQDELALGPDSGEATETAIECGSDTCSTKTPGEVEMFLYLPFLD